LPPALLIKALIQNIAEEMSFQVNRFLRHCYQLPSLASTLEAATQPYARAVGSTLGIDFRRGFAEEGRTPPPQAQAPKPEPSSAENSPPPHREQGGSPTASCDPEGTVPPKLQASAAPRVAEGPSLQSQGVLEFGEVLDNTFKVLKSRTTPLVVENPAQSVSLLRMLSDSVKAYISSLFITKTIETSHSDEEFLAGAGDAFQTVFDMVHEKDWKGLEAMVYPAALKGFKTTYEEHSKNGLQLNFMPARDVEPQSAMFSIMHRNMIARFGEDGEVAGKDDYPKETPTPAAVASPGTATAALDPPAPAFDVSSLLSRLPKPDPTQYYQIATVAFKASLEAEVKREEDGQVVLKSTDHRRQLWMFARGPLPTELPRRELDLQWKVLAII